MEFLGKSIYEWIFALCFAFGLMWFMSGMPGCSTIKDAGSSSGVGGSYYACTNAIRSRAKNPSSVTIPYAQPKTVGSSTTFEWRRGSGLTMQNGFGAKIDVGAICETSNGYVTDLTFDGI